MEWSPVTHPLLKSSFIDDGKRYWAESPFFFTLNGINGSVAYQDEPSSYQQSPCNKETNEQMHGRNIRFGQDLNQGHLVERQYHNYWTKENSPERSC